MLEYLSLKVDRIMIQLGLLGREPCLVTIKKYHHDGLNKVEKNSSTLDNSALVFLRFCRNVIIHLNEVRLTFEF